MRLPWLALAYLTAVHAQDTPPLLTSADVQAVVSAAASSVDSEALDIAVTDRQGNVLAVFHKNAVPASVEGNFGVVTDTDDIAVGLARTASFSATIRRRFLLERYDLSANSFSAEHCIYLKRSFVRHRNTNRGCPLNIDFLDGQALPPATALDGISPGPGIVTGKTDLGDSDQRAVNPGGVPLFKQGVLVGGVGVAVSYRLSPNTQHSPALWERASVPHRRRREWW